MVIGQGSDVANLPEVHFRDDMGVGRAGRPAALFARALTTCLRSLIWNALPVTPQPQQCFIQAVEPEDYAMAEIISDETRLASSAASFLRYQRYLSRRFVVYEGRDIAMSLHAKAVAAPGYGLINEFNVGGAIAVPLELLERDFSNHDGRLYADERVVQRVGGFSIPLCHYGLGTFGHFVLDALLQVYVFRRELQMGDARLLHWPLPQPWMLAALETCGVARTARREVSGPVILMERAGLSSALAGHGVYFPSSLSLAFFDWLRALFHAPASQGRRKLYIRRSGSYGRSIQNESALEALVEQHGFQVVIPETYSIADQMRLFAEAGVVVSAWGSSLTLTPLLGGARCVLEILPTSVTDAWFSRQAVVHKLDYRPFIAPADRCGNVLVDLDRFDRALQKLPR